MANQLQSLPLLNTRCSEPHTGRGAHGAVLEHHAHDGNHRQAAVGKLSVQFALPALRVAHGPARIGHTQDAGILIVARVPGRVGPVETGVNQAAEEGDLQPTEWGHLGESRESVGHVRELDARGGGEEPGELEVLRREVPDCGEHGDAAVLELNLAAAFERVHIAILGVADGIPEAHRSLHAKLILEGPQGRVSVEGPVAPSRAREAILIEQADDGHHCQPTIG
mmetsp:Transcript_50609/g.108389  ORF Transcript_50609/g.108389 Transcript_50609/m.108389 type:complete len:224 (-) Transcript_50609:335-1006(-)